MGGSAPVSEDTLSYFMSVNIPIHELYGMSESTGPTTVSTVDSVRFRSSGRPFDGVELMINEPDECGNGEVREGGRSTNANNLHIFNFQDTSTRSSYIYGIYWGASCYSRYFHSRRMAKDGRHRLHQPCMHTHTHTHMLTHTHTHTRACTCT